MRGWIPALRIARREARKTKGRSSLVLAMIGLPVAFLAFAAVSYDMFTLTVQEVLDRKLGAADAHITWFDTNAITQSPDGSNWNVAGPDTADDTEDAPPPGEAELLALLPPGSRVVRLEEHTVKVRTAVGIANAQARTGDVSDPLLRGTVKLLAGRAATADGEVVVNAEAAEWLGVGVGGTIRTVGPDQTHIVTGLVEYPDSLWPTIVFPRGPGNSSFWLADTPAPVDWAQVKRLNRSGMVVVSRAVVLDPPAGELEDFSVSGAGPEELAMGVVIAGLGGLEVILLAGPAFAVGARRRSRDLALVAAAGGEPKQLRRIVLADGVVLGLVGAIVGLALGVLLALAGRPLIEEHLSHARGGGYRFFPLALLGIAALAVITGMLAALVPAFTAARQHVALALAGRRGVLRSRKRWILLGIGLAAAGTATGILGAVRPDEVMMLAGVVLVEVGLVLVTPALIGLIARLGRWLPLAPRLALRDTARNRSSAAPAISAIMAAVAGAVTAGIFFAGIQEQQIADYQHRLPLGHARIQHHAAPDQPSLDWAQAESMVRSVLPGADVHRFGHAWDLGPMMPPERECPYHQMGRSLTDQERQAGREDERCTRPNRYGIGIIVDDGASLAAFTRADPQSLAKAREVLSRGGAVTTDALLVKDGRIAFQSYRDRSSVLSVEGYLLDGERDRRVTVTMLSPKAIDGSTRTTGLVIGTDAAPTGEQEERLDLLLHQLDSDVELLVERGPQGTTDLTALGIAAIAALIALAAAGIATGLAAADSRADLGTLASVGAAPRMRRRLSLSQAGVISGLGALLGLVTGLGAAAVLVAAFNNMQLQYQFQYTPMPLLIPWDIVAVVVAVPLVAMAGAGLLTRSRLPIERRL